MRFASSKTKWDQNLPLINCLEDGVPVGVLIGQPTGGYRVLGLAFVERYNERTGFFTLHGPVNASTKSQRILSSFVSDELSVLDKARLRELQRLAVEDGDERIKRLMHTAKREQQKRFRQEVYAAYDGKCAACGTEIYDILQAAHIDDFRGRKSQIVQNGVLLRVDIHMLYDANLLGIEPGSHRIVLAGSADLAPYEYLSDAQLRVPRERRLWPDDELLEIHYRRFVAQQAVA